MQKYAVSWTLKICKERVQLVRDERFAHAGYESEPDRPWIIKAEFDRTERDTLITRFVII